tara:strand:+ start:312 stop:836 length:525 start_codon:yes stop_codon:yes gene_type:complete
MIADLNIIERGNGGDARLIGRDLYMNSGWENMPYLAMFGGNVEQDTAERNAGEQVFDFWANTMISAEDPDKQFNSQTERRLMNVPLNSAGRISIEQAIKADLKFMQAFAAVSVETAITGPDRLEITIKVIKPNQLSEQIYIYLWDGLLGTIELVSLTGILGDFNNDFNDDFYID